MSHIYDDRTKSLDVKGSNPEALEAKLIPVGKSLGSVSVSFFSCENLLNALGL